jgi:NADH-quinone oxidoreductase subunit M
MVPFHLAAAAAIREGSLVARVLVSLAATSVCGYGFLRIVLPLFPAQCASLGLIIWAVALLGSLYAAVALRGETDARRLEGGATALCVCVGLTGSLSLTAAGFLGSLLLCVSWPLSLTLWSIVSGNGERNTLRSLTTAHPNGERNEFRSTFPVPRLIAVLSLIGVPGLAAFPGLLLILRGVFQAEQALPGVSFLPLTVLWGALLIAAWAFVRHATSHADGVEAQRDSPNDSRPLASGRRPGRVGAILLLVGLIVWLGLAPGVVVQRAEPTFATAARAAGLRGPL